MSIDWFTVIAQLLNFLILVWLMKRFLYQPIINAINAREKRIAAELADADAKKVEALKELNEYQQKNDDFDQKRGALMNQAKEEIKVERQKLLEKAHQEIDALSAKKQNTMDIEARNLYKDISRRTRQEVFAIAHKALSDLGSVRLEEHLGEVFIRRLHNIDGNSKDILAKALKTTSEPALLRSAFDLSKELRTAIQNALNDTFADEIHVRFETSPDLISGIELTTNGQKLGWNISDYLTTMEKDVNEILREGRYDAKIPTNPEKGAAEHET